MSEIVLDARIRDWVLIPILLVMIIVSALRHYLAILTKSKPKSDEKVVRESQTLLRARYLRENGSCIPAAGFKARKAFFNHKEKGIFEQEFPHASMSSMMDPNNMGNMMEMMKKNMVGGLGFTLQNIAIMTWVNYLFSGFIIAKFPFPLTNRFRGMVQRGIELASLDVSYVTSLSMYFLIMFGLRGLLTLLLGEGSPDQMADMQKQQQQQMQMMMMGGGAGMDTAKIYKAEKENLELVVHDFALKDVEAKLLSSSSSSS
eukprot:GEZU01012478.1.p1 GENE.GEZU01012478.1~~GEZU01012478.1.p1  ORF type:complete len:259 (+),score=73.63 GEZU01012478.1:624-1400(+)